MRYGWDHLVGEWQFGTPDKVQKPGYKCSPAWPAGLVPNYRRAIQCSLKFDLESFSYLTPVIVVPFDIAAKMFEHIVLGYFTLAVSGHAN